MKCFPSPHTAGETPEPLLDLTNSFIQYTNKKVHPKIIWSYPCVILSAELYISCMEQESRSLSECLRFPQWKWMLTRDCTASKRTNNIHYGNSLYDLCTVFHVFWSFTFNEGKRAAWKMSYRKKEKNPQGKKSIEGQ